MQLFNSEIIGMGSKLPDRIVTNKDLEVLLETTDEWIKTRTGIEQRHWVVTESTADLSYEAALKALTQAQFKASDVQAIIMATSTPDHQVPGSGVLVQARLGLFDIPVFEMRQACSGFLYSISLADKLIGSGQYENVLILAAEVQSKLMDKTPRGRAISVLFGDGAGAVLLKRKKIIKSQAPPANQNDSLESHVVFTEVHADGRYAKELWLPGPGTSSELGEHWLSENLIGSGNEFVSMNGKHVFQHAVVKMPEVLKSACDQSGYKIEDIDLFFFHQANLRINQKIVEDLGLDPKKVYNTIHKYGNTTAATIPLGMVDAYNAGVLKKGMLIALVSFGAGFTWGASIVRY